MRSSQLPKSAIAGACTSVKPLVITASRATDLPAFYGAWFRERLRAGYCVWRNPFNARQAMRVSFAQCRVWVFFSKNPAPFLPYLPALEAQGYHYYFHYTLNDYVAEYLEPHLPALATRLDIFKQLADRIGPERVIWRYDPIMLGQSLPIERVLERIDRIGHILAPFTSTLVFSYLDLYQKTARALRRVDSSLRAPRQDEMQSLAQGIANANATWPKRLHLASCAEAVDLSPWAVTKNCCVDPALICQLCPNDAAVQALYGGHGPRAALEGQGTFQEQGSLLADIAHPKALMRRTLKDKGQRKACGCAPSKDIGAYNTCMHGCVYCYACQSPQAVAQNVADANPARESLA